MNEYDHNTRPSFIKKHRVLAASLTVLILATAGFAAAGGVDFVRGLLVTVSVDAQAIEGIETSGEMATITVTTADGGDPIVTIEDADGNQVPLDPADVDIVIEPIDDLPIDGASEQKKD